MFESAESLEEMVIRQIQVEQLQKAMQTLTENQKERLHLYFYEGKTIREIDKEEGVSVNGVWKSIQGALASLRKYMK